MAEEIYRYWIAYVDCDGNLNSGEVSVGYALDTGDAIRKAEAAIKFSNGDDRVDAVKLLTWKRLQ